MIKSLSWIVILTGCDSPAFAFSATLSVENGSEVLIDGLSVEVVEQQATFRMEYDSYQTARSDDVHDVHVFAGGVLQQEGSFRPGICAQACSVGACPPLNGMIREEVELPFGRNFTVGDFDCANCISEDVYTTVCGE